MGGQWVIIKFIDFNVLVILFEDQHAESKFSFQLHNEIILLNWLW